MKTTKKTMKTYFELTKQEKLDLTDNDLPDLCRITAIAKGVKPPIPFSEAVTAVAPLGFRIEQDEHYVYEVATHNGYGNFAGTGISFETEQEADNFIHGQRFIFIESTGYNATKKNIISREGKITVMKTRLNSSAAKAYTEKIDRIECREDGFDQEEWDTVCKDVMSDYKLIKQGAYDLQVRKEKRTEYLRLANDDEAIAKAFWNKTEAGDFPEASEFYDTETEKQSDKAEN